MQMVSQGAFSGIKGLVLDCDGVMIDSEDANRFFYNSILAVLNLPPMTPAQEKYAFMASAQDALLKMVPPAMHSRIADASAKAMDYSRDVLPKIRLMPGLVPFLDAAKARGLRLGIDTNRTREGIERVLDFFGLREYFDPVVSSSIAPPKPLPDGALSICNAWQIQPDAALFVGDSENDMLTARNAGMRFMAFQNPELPVSAHVSSFANLATELWQ